MLTRRATTYSTSCLQVVLVYVHPFRRNLLVLECAMQPKIAKKYYNPYIGNLWSFKIINVDTSKKLIYFFIILICNKHSQQTSENNNIEKQGKNYKYY